MSDREKLCRCQRKYSKYCGLYISLLLDSSPPFAPLEFSKAKALDTYIVFISLLLDSTMKRTLSTQAAEQFKHLKIIEAKPFVYNVQMNREKKMNALNKQLWW